MKLKLPKASELRKKQVKIFAAKKQSLKSFVTNWLNTEVLSAIRDIMEQDINPQGVMVRSPQGSYEWGNDFYNEVRNQLKPLGYYAEESHDGGGMYATTYIWWFKEKS